MTPVIAVVLKSWIQPLPPPTLESVTIQPVMLLPRIEPRMTLTACENCISPEFTKPTHMTLAALEDWMTAVTSVPSRMPRKRLLVSR